MSPVCRSPASATADAARLRPPLRRPAPPPGFRLTRRAGILALALCTVLVTVAYPLQEYFAQRARIAAQEQQNARQAAQIRQLQAALKQWADPDYVAIQARERLHYVQPGEIGLTVPSPTGGLPPLGLPSPTASPWYDNLWNSVTSPSVTPSPDPAADRGRARRPLDRHGVAASAETDTLDRVSVDEADVKTVEEQLGRPTRGLRAVAHRCPCGHPDVVETAPRLPDGAALPDPLLPHLPAARPPRSARWRAAA